MNKFSSNVESTTIALSWKCNFWQSWMLFDKSLLCWTADACAPLSKWSLPGRNPLDTPLTKVAPTEIRLAFLLHLNSLDHNLF